MTGPPLMTSQTRGAGAGRHCDLRVRAARTQRARKRLVPVARHVRPTLARWRAMARLDVTRTLAHAARCTRAPPAALYR